MVKFINLVPKVTSMKVFSTYHLPGNLEEKFQSHNIQYTENPFNRSLTRDEIIQMAKDCDGLISLLSDNIDKEVIGSLTCCKIIANYAVGFNNIDLDSAKANGIVVTNTPGILTDATAEITFALILAAARNLRAGEMMVRENRFTGWKPELLTGPGLSGKVLGIVGAGRIAQAVARIAVAFKMKMIYYSRSRKPEMPGEFSDLENLMRTSDFISLHIPLNPETRGLISAPMLELMKKDAVFINTSRGEIVNEKHLIGILKNNNIYAAGFDVYTNEPAIDPELLSLDNAVLLPHLGSATFETRKAMAHLAADNIIAVLTGDKPLSPVGS